MLLGIVSEVLAVWQWSNCYEDLMPQGKVMLRINLDETAVKTYANPTLGLVSLSPKLTAARRKGMHVHPASRHKQLGCFTHVACICDNTEVQAALPHFFIGNWHVLPMYVQQRAQPLLHENVTLWRHKSAWCTASVMKEVLKLIK